MKLAQDRGLVVPSDGPSRLPALLQRYQRRLQHFIFDDFTASTVPVTDFQERIWDALSQQGDAALSAPTSAGKSFVLVRWLVQSLLSSDPGGVMAYVVPSRALINQVSRNISDMLIKYDVRPRIVTLPTLYQEDPQRATILVMTQERIERLFAAKLSLCLRTLVVDEAHKLGEGPRGVILQRVIDEALGRSGDCRVVLAAPHAENAGVLLPRPDRVQGASITAKVISDSRPTVLQNLFWVTPVPRRSARWCVTLVRENEVGKIGEFRLEGKAIGKKKQLAALAFHLGGCEGGNIVFANGAAEAEDVALLLREHAKASAQQGVREQEVLDLARLVKDSVHPLYPLVETLPQGVGIHYGDMPEIARRDQERLFDKGKLSFLVCTSTLLEGVNLPCRNLFVWGPRQGRGNPMTEHAFWNLAGRAGRWGREFAGNIFCIDVHDLSQWPLGAPSRRYAQKVTHSGSALLGQLERFREFAEALDPATASRENRYFEQILGELVGARLDGRDVSTIGWARWGTEEQIRTLAIIVDSVLGRVLVSQDLIRRHRGINPILVSRFIEHLNSLSPDSAESLMPMTPDMPDALEVLSDNLLMIDEHLGGVFGNQAQRNLKAKITIDWMRGLPLGRIIRERIDYLLSQRRIKVPAEIRSVIRLINENPRYLIPKYLSCYSDCVAHWFTLIGRDDLADEVTDIQDMLESGVAERTMIALIGLGLSRTAAVELAGHIPKTELSIDGVITWLRERSLEVYGISPVIIREVERALASTEFL
ncbi:MAG: DEAD/DEAH box helicase [Verrucomicrobia bacterium]|nr:DEAD/DEAH box helicase [Verrucomicrobiota bacterium]